MNAVNAKHLVLCTLAFTRELGRLAFVVRFQFWTHFLQGRSPPTYTYTRRMLSRTSWNGLPRPSTKSQPPGGFFLKVLKVAVFQDILSLSVNVTHPCRGHKFAGDAWNGYAKKKRRVRLFEIFIHNHRNDAAKGVTPVPRIPGVHQKKIGWVGAKGKPARTNRSNRFSRLPC